MLKLHPILRLGGIIAQIISEKNLVKIPKTSGEILIVILEGNTTEIRGKIHKEPREEFY